MTAKELIARVLADPALPDAVKAAYEAELADLDFDRRANTGPASDMRKVGVVYEPDPPGRELGEPGYVPPGGVYPKRRLPGAPDALKAMLLQDIRLLARLKRAALVEILPLVTPTQRLVCLQVWPPWPPSVSPDGTALKLAEAYLVEAIDRVAPPGCGAPGP